MAHHKVTVDIGGSTLTIETGKLAKQSSGSVVVSQGDSSVLVTAEVGNDPRPFDFLPLTVDYQDRTASYGRIPGGFLKREGRPNERETLTARLIDRPLRPQFPKHFRNELQVIATVLSYDPANDTRVLALIGASAACHVSKLPLNRPVAGVRVALVDGELVVGPTNQQAEEAQLELIVAGTSDAVCMVEGHGKEVSETTMMDAIDLAHHNIKKIIAAIEELRSIAGAEKIPVAAPPAPDAAIAAKVAELGTDRLVAAMATPGKHERGAAIKAARNAVIAELTAGHDNSADVARITDEVKQSWHKLVGKLMRNLVIEKGVRIDGRATDEIRGIVCEVGVATRAHGSALFTRGETQGFVTATLGVDRDDQRIDHADQLDHTRKFMLQYNFPPFCVGEVGRMGGVKRREVGHANLARRGLKAMLPTSADFPYILRISSDILESNGSSSMATVCGGTLALLDAGVPMVRPVAGIAMGLIKQDGQYVVLSDILGDEDHLGDMDFKVTGTSEGITAFQMDTKIDSIPREVMLRAMNQAREGRLHILDEMSKVISAPRAELSPFAPRITAIQIKVDRIRDIIGPGGKTIRGIQERTGTRLNVDDSGRVEIASTDQDAADKAMAMIRELTQEAEIGQLYLGVVKRTVDFGAFVEIFPGTEGLIHISHLAVERVNRTTDVVNEGDEVLVRVIDIDRSGKVRLSRKEALEAAGDL